MPDANARRTQHVHRRTRSLATICTRQNETHAGGRLLASNSMGMQTILCTGAAAVKRGGSARSGSHAGVARLARSVQAEGAAHLLVDDADVVLDATRFQGVRLTPWSRLEHA
jgi:hypothetical protein